MNRGVLALVLVAGCSTVVTGDAASTSITSATTSTTAPTSLPTTTAISTTTTTAVPPPGAEVRVPQGEESHPAVVLVHGGLWLVGHISQMTGLAEHLTGAGFITVNTTYRLEPPGYPGAVEDVACAVAYARTLTDGNVYLVGHSAGAQIGALVALTGDRYRGECPHPGDPRPDGFVGLSGPYDIALLGFVVVPFLGVGVDEAPEVWEAANPIRHVQANPDLQVLLVHGAADPVVPFAFSVQFSEAIAAAGVEVTLEILDDVDHAGARLVDNVGDLVTTWLSG